MSLDLAKLFDLADCLHAVLALLHETHVLSCGDGLAEAGLASCNVAQTRLFSTKNSLFYFVLSHIRQILF